MDETKCRKHVLQAVDGFRPVHQAWIFGQADFHVEAADKIKAKRMEGADPHGCGGILVLEGDAFSHFARRLVGKGENEDATRIDPVGEKAFDASGQGLRLACSRPRLKQISATPMRRRRSVRG